MLLSISLTKVCLSSGNGLLLTGNKQLSKPLMTMIYDTIFLERWPLYWNGDMGSVSMWRCCITGIGIPIIKIRYDLMTILSLQQKSSCPKRPSLYWDLSLGTVHQAYWLQKVGTFQPVFTWEPSKADHRFGAGSNQVPLTHQLGESSALGIQISKIITMYQGLGSVKNKVYLSF